jgi:hypothetical protein
LQKEQNLLFLTAKQACFAVSDILIDCLFAFTDTRRKGKVQGFRANSPQNLASEQFKNATKPLQLLRF